MLAADLRERVVSGFELASRVIFGVIRLIMWAGAARRLRRHGVHRGPVRLGASLQSLGLLMVTFWGTCAIFVFVRPRARRAAGSGFSILRLIRLIRDELLIIVGTSSSETVLPRLLAKLEAAGASRQTVGS